MATSPQFIGTPNNSWKTLVTQNQAMDGTGTVETIFTASASGGYIQKITAKALGNNVATVLRIFENNGGDNSAPANNCLIYEKSLALITGFGHTTETTNYEILLERSLPAGYKLNCVIGTTVASGWAIAAQGGNF